MHMLELQVFGLPKCEEAGEGRVLVSEEWAARSESSLLKT